jgi:transglutaminase-like putative cysteine protease
MSALGGWILRRLDARELLKLALLAAVLAAAVFGVVPLIFRSDTSLFLSAVLFGMLAGWITGRIPLPPAAAGGVDAALGIDFLFLAVGRLDVPLLRWIGESAAGLAHLLPQNWDRGFDAAAWGADANRILMGAFSLISRFRVWAVSILRGENFFDPVASAFFWSLLLFLIGAFAGWALCAGRKPFAAALPAAFLYAAVASYTHGDWRYAVLIAALIFLMVVVTEQSLKEQEWERKEMGYSTGIRWDLFFSAGPVLAGLIFAAYLIPSISLDDISRWIREQSQPSAATGNAVGQSFGLNPVGGGRENPTENEAFPRSHYLGSGPNLTRDVALTVVTGETLVYLPGMREPSAPRHYWKAQTFDIYTGSGWITSSTEEQEMQAGARIQEATPYGIALHQTVTVSRSGFGPIYVAGEPVSVYALFRVVWRTDGDIFGVIVPGSQYEADSVYVAAGEAALRAAGMDYPDWIRGRYLQLPKILPQRVHALARDLTAALPTPYDRAVAIQEYLRREMQYTLAVDAPPYEEDVVDYFLFTSKEGFCDYYATAMVVLARSAGIPARIAFGYASGTFDPAQGKYTVLDSDAHAWPELYFPGIGWVEFEPTSSMPEVRRPAAEAAAPAAPLTPQEANPQPSPVWNRIREFARRSAFPALIGLLAIPWILLAWNLLAPLRLLALAPAPLMQAVYRGLLAHGRRQRVPFSKATTPAEFTDRLARKNPGCRVLLERLAEAYSRQVYGGKRIDARQRREVILIWAGLDRSLWWAWGKAKLRALRNPRIRLGGRSA